MRMKRIIFLLMLISAIALSFQCNSGDVKTKVKKDGSTNGKYWNPYFPLKEGNKWVYESDTKDPENRMFTVKISDQKETDLDLQLKASSFPYLTKENTEQELKVNSNGEVIVKDYFSATGVFVPAESDMKNGYTWNLGIFTGRVSNEPNSVTTESGTFENCIYVLMTDGFTFSFEMWYKKDIGIVKWGANRTNPPILQPEYFTLKEYNLN